MTEATFPQCRILTERLLDPETMERLLNKFVVILGIWRIFFNGLRLPVIVMYGFAKGFDNFYFMRKMIYIGD